MAEDLEKLRRRDDGRLVGVNEEGEEVPIHFGETDHTELSTESLESTGGDPNIFNSKTHHHGGADFENNDAENIQKASVQNLDYRDFPSHDHREALRAEHFGRETTISATVSDLSPNLWEVYYINIHQWRIREENGGDTPELTLAIEGATDLQWVWREWDDENDEFNSGHETGNELTLIDSTTTGSGGVFHTGQWKLSILRNSPVLRQVDAWGHGFERTGRYLTVGGSDTLGSDGQAQDPFDLTINATSTEDMDFTWSVFKLPRADDLA